MNHTNIQTAIMLGYTLLLFIVVFVLFIMLLNNTRKNSDENHYPKAAKPKRYPKEVENKLRIID